MALTRPRPGVMLPTLAIRPFEPSDLPALLAVWEAVSAVAHSFLSDEFLAHERENIAGRYPQVAEIWVATDGEALVGFISLVGSNEVGILFVDPDRQRSGVGSALMDHARRLRGRLEVDVFAENATGRAFYRTYGFREVGRKNHHLAGHELVRMRLDPTLAG